ncbi:MAG: ATP-binding protein [Polyangiaceae bacterium]
MSLRSPERLFVRGPLRAELLAIAWEGFSAVLFGSTVLPEVGSSPWPSIAFAGSLLLSAVLLPTLLKLGRRGLVIAGAMRVVAWPLSLLTLTDDARVLVATAAFGAMAWALRRAIYRRELWRFDPVKDGASGGLVRARLAESAMVTGIIGGHVLVLFSVAFLHADSKMLFQGWWTFVPTIGIGATAVFTIVVRLLSRPLIDALAGGPGGDPARMREAIAAAHKLPLRLSLLNFGIWVACTTVGVFYFRTSPDRFEVLDAIMQIAYAALFSWGVSFSQRGWDRETLEPVERLLSSWLPAGARAPAAEPERALPLRSRMFRDFGGPLVFTAALSLLSSIGLYRTINRAVSVREDLNAILALSAAFVLLVIAVGAVILRVARNLSRPLSIVAGTAETVAAGRLEARVDEVVGPEEVVGLARSVERMRETLARTIAELEHERATLEANVKTRTAELTRALEELRDAQAALVQGERLASIGELVAGVAHEIYNPLNAVAGSTEPLERVAADVRAMLDAYRSAEAALPKDHRERIEKLRRELDIDASLDDLVGISSLVKRATNRTVRIVQNLKNFSRRPVEAQPADLHAALDETLLLLGSRIRQSCIQVTTDFARDTLPEVTCRVGEINQVFMNLLMNSIQALESVPEEERGRGSDADASLRQIRIETRAERTADKASAVISFADNGPGVPEEIESKIFTPFFTTKPAGQGTGLGLSISSDIIRKHGGTLTLERAKGAQGARLVVRLPL